MSPKSTGQASRLGGPAWADVAVLRQNFSFLRNLFLFLRPSTDWTRPIHIAKVTSFTESQLNGDVNHIYRISSQPTPRLGFIKVWVLSPSQADTSNHHRHFSPFLYIHVIYTSICINRQKYRDYLNSRFAFLALLCVSQLGDHEGSNKWLKLLLTLQKRLQVGPPFSD